MNRRSLAPTLALAALLAPACAGAETYREQSTLAVEVAGIRTVVAENTRGRIEIRPSADRRLHITALKIARSGSLERARSLAQGIQVTTGAQGDRYVVHVRYPQSQHISINIWDMMGGESFPRGEVRLVLEVPATVAVRAEAVSGDVYSDDLAIAQSLHTVSGDLDIQNAHGALEITTTSGDVTANGVRGASASSTSGDLEFSDVSGSLRARSSSGDITVHGAHDSLLVRATSGDVRVDAAPRGADVETGSGSVRIRAAAGLLHVGTSSGDVGLTLQTPLRSAEVTTSSGEIHVWLAGTLGCALEMHTASGSLDVNVPVTMKRVSRVEVSGLVRNGTAPVTLRSASGDITLSSGQEQE